MEYIFLLSGDYIGLAKEEILSLLDIANFKSIGRLMVAEVKNNERSIFQRLALTKSIYRFLFECKTDDLADAMKKYDWNSVYSGSFCLRMINLDSTSITKKPIKNYLKLSEKNLAGYVWDSVRNPKVSLESPKTLIQLFITKNKAYCGLLIFENEEDFESRKSHLRPFPSPSSLHPKLARALANISEVKENEVLLDPFCGAGGFLIEAGLMEIKSIGYDISKIMIKGCEENLEHFKIKKCRIRRHNAVSIIDKFDCAVTDLPYGLNSNVLTQYGKNWKKYRLNKKIQQKDFIKNLEQFYLKFLKGLRKKLKKKAVIVFPSYVDYRKLLKKAKFRIEKEFSNYVHRSLTRKIVKVG